MFMALVNLNNELIIIKYMVKYNKLPELYTFCNDLPEL